MFIFNYYIQLFILTTFTIKLFLLLKPFFFKDLLFIGNQSRPQIFEFDIRLPELLYEEVIEIDERLILVNKHCQSDFEAFRVMASNGEEVC